MSECEIHCAVSSVVRCISDRHAGLGTPSSGNSSVAGCTTSGCVHYCDHADTVDDIADIINGLDRILVLMDGHNTLTNLLTSRLHMDGGGRRFPVMRRFVLQQLQRSSRISGQHLSESSSAMALHRDVVADRGSHTPRGTVFDGRRRQSFHRAVSHLQGLRKEDGHEVGTRFIEILRSSPDVNTALRDWQEHDGSDGGVAEFLRTPFVCSMMMAR